MRNCIALVTLLSVPIVPALYYWPCGMATATGRAGLWDNIAIEIKSYRLKACADRVTRRLGTVHAGMPRATVEAILGPPVSGLSHAGEGFACGDYPYLINNAGDVGTVVLTYDTTALDQPLLSVEPFRPGCH